MNEQFIEVRVIGSSTRWGNVFLLNTWTLIIDMNPDQHEYAMERLGIDPASVLLSGHYYKYGVSFRSSYSKELTEDHAVRLIKAIKNICKYGPHAQKFTG